MRTVPRMILPALVLASALPSACAPAVAPARVSAVASAANFETPVSITSAGALMRGTMYVADGAGPHPTVLLLHGFPGRTQWASMAGALQQAGFNVLFMHYRGAWGSEGDFDLVNAKEDVEAALTFLRSPSAQSAYRVDPGAIALVGHSMGGWLAFQTAVRRRDPQCVAGLAVTDVGEVGRRIGAEPDYRQGWARSIARATTGEAAPIRMRMSVDSTMASLVAEAPRNDLTRLAAPLRDRTMLLVGATRDEVAPLPQHHARLRDALRTAGAANLTEVMLQADHGFQGNQDALAASVTEWLQRECLPVVRGSRR